MRYLMCIRIETLLPTVGDVIIPKSLTISPGVVVGLESRMDIGNT